MGGHISGTINTHRRDTTHVYMEYLVWNSSGFQLVIFKLRLPRPPKIWNMEISNRNFRGSLACLCPPPLPRHSALHGQITCVCNVHLCCVIFRDDRVRLGGSCCCCCSHINSHNQVRGHRTGSSHSGAEEYPREKTQTKGGTHIYHS